MSIQHDQERTRRLREQVVRTGRLLGWGADDVARFARALTGRDWEACSEPELEEVLAEYETLLEACYAKRARKEKGRVERV